MRSLGPDRLIEDTDDALAPYPLDSNFERMKKKKKNRKYACKRNFRMLLWVDESSFRPSGAETLAALSCSGFSVMRRFRTPARLESWLQKSLKSDSSESVTVVSSWQQAKTTVASLQAHLSSVDLVLVTCADEAFEEGRRWCESLAEPLAARILLCRDLRDVHSCLVIWRCRKLLQNMKSSSMASSLAYELLRSQSTS